MKFKLLGIFVASMLVAITSQAQAPVGSTGQCKDGTYTSVAKKSGACSGHKGVQAWYGTAGKGAATAPAPASKPAAMTPTPASKPAAAPTPAATMAKPVAAAAPPAARPAPAAAPDAGDIASAKARGMVWANLNTKVYHSSADKEYGTTKNGKFMTEADAKAAGFKLAKH